MFHDRYPEYHALMDAVSRRDVAGVRAMLSKGTKPNVYPPSNFSEDDQAPINAAADTGDTTITGMLLDAGADIETSDPWGGPPLNVAARDDDVDMLKFLISRGAKVNDLGKDGSSALYGAAVEGKMSAVKYLLAQGANPRTRVGGNTALEAARTLGQGATAAILEQAQED